MALAFGQLDWPVFFSPTEQGSIDTDSFRGVRSLSLPSPLSIRELSRVWARG